MSSTSSKRLSSVKESPEFVKTLWTDGPGPSRPQNEYVLEGQGMRGVSGGGDSDDTIDANISATSHGSRGMDLKQNSFTPKPLVDTITGNE